MYVVPISFGKKRGREFIVWKGKINEMMTHFGYIYIYVIIIITAELMSTARRQQRTIAVATSQRE